MVNQRFLQCYSVKPIFHCKLGLCWLTNNMKCTWPIRRFCVGDPTQPIFLWLASGFCIGGNANFMFRVEGNANLRGFRDQYVGIPNAKLWRWGSKPTQGPNANGFASQWNIGLKHMYTQLFYGP